MKEKEPSAADALDDLRREAAKYDSVTSLAGSIPAKAEEEKTNMEVSGWSLPINVMGKELNAQEQLSKMLKSAKFVKDKGQALINLDPTGYLKMAWIAFSLCR